jgi:hypothetical protein
VATETFTASNGTQIETLTGWDLNNGALDIFSNTLAPDSGGVNSLAHQTDVLSADQFAQGTVVNQGVVVIGVAVRVHASDHTGYTFNTENGATYIQKFVTGTETLLDSGTGVATNSVIRLEISGTTLTPLDDGATPAGVTASFTDSAIASGFAGVCGYDDGNQQRLDTWSSGALGGGGATGTAAVSLPNLTASASGTQTQTGTAAPSLPNLTASATGVMQPAGTVAVTLPSLTASATGTHTTPFAGSGIDWKLLSIESATPPLAAGATRYYNPSGSNEYPDTVEARAQIKVYQQFRWKNLALRAGNPFYTSGTPTIDASSTVRSRINGANGNQTFTIPATTAGDFEDATNVDDLESGDLISVSIVTGAGTGTLSYGAITSLLESPSDAPNVHVHGQNRGDGNTYAQNQDVYYPIDGTMFPGSAAAVSITFRTATTLRNGRIYIVTNTNTQTSTLTLYKNGSPTALVISITGSTTGAFENTADDVSFAVGDTAYWRLETGNTGGGAVGPAAIQIDAEGAARRHILQGQAGLSAAHYGTIHGEHFFNSEAPAAYAANVDTGFKNLYAYVSANTKSGVTPITFRVNGVSVITISVPASTTGLFEETATVANVVAGDDINYMVDASGGTGTISVELVSIEQLSATEATGTAAVTLGSLTSAATGVMHPAGTAAATLASLTAAASGTQIQTGTAAVTLASLTAAATGTQAQTGTAAPSLAALTASATGVMQPSGSAAPSLSALTTAASGTHEQTGTAAPSLAALTASASGTQTTDETTGTAAVTLASLSADATGTHEQTGTAAITLPSLAAAATGVMQPSGTAAPALSALTASATGTHEQTGTGAATLGSLTAAASGTSLEGTTGSAAVSLASLAAAATGVMQPSGAAVVTLPSLTASATATHEQTGTATPSLAALTASATGTQTQTGTGSATLPSLVAAATGTQVYTGTATPTLPSLTAAATGFLPVTGTASPTLPSLTAAATGSLPSARVTALAATWEPTIAKAGTWETTVSKSAEWDKTISKSARWE